MSSVATPDPEHLPEVNNAPKTKKRRLASDIIGQLEDKLKEDDSELSTWTQLIARTVEKDKIESVREVYANFHDKFPFLGSYWASDAEYEISRGEFDKANDRLIEALKASSGIEVWRSYVNFIRRKNNLITGGEEARRVIFQAYDAAVNVVGTDPNAGSFWSDYIRFIDDWKPNSTWEEQQKMDMKRKAYKRALQIPLDNLEQLWSEYTAFENDLNQITARKFIGEISGAYMNARSLYKEWLNATEGIKRKFDADSIPTPSAYDSEQLKKWRNWLKWEAENKLQLTEPEVTQRVVYVYKEAIQMLVYYPEIWFEYAEYYNSLLSHVDISNIQEILSQGLSANPISFALNFKMIEIYESQQNAEAIKRQYETLIEKLHKKRAAVAFDLEYSKERVDKDIMASKIRSAGEDEEVKPLTDEEKSLYYKKSRAVQTLLKEFGRWSKIISMTYCHYIKTTQRVSGMPKARAIFKICRNTVPPLTHHYFVQSALLEHEQPDNPIRGLKTALNIFELGLRPSFFQYDGEFIYKYLKFLVSVNDETNSRTVFETTMTTKREQIDARWLKKMFKVFMAYELKLGGVESQKKLENRYFQMFPDESKILLFADRYSLNPELDDYNLEDDLIRSVDLKNSEVLKRDEKRQLEEADEDGNESKYDLLGDDQEIVEPTEAEPAMIGGAPTVDPAVTTLSVGGSQFVTDEIYNLLRILPNASYIDTPVFNNSKLIKLLSEMN